MDFRRDPELRINRLTHLAVRLDARLKVLARHRSSHAICMGGRYTLIELEADRVAMAMVGPYSPND